MGSHVLPLPHPAQLGHTGPGRLAGGWARAPPPQQARCPVGVGRRGVVSARPWAAAHPPATGSGVCTARPPPAFTAECKWEALCAGRSFTSSTAKASFLSIKPPGWGQMEGKGVQERFSTVFKQFT